VFNAIFSIKHQSIFFLDIYYFPSFQSSWDWNRFWLGL